MLSKCANPECSEQFRFLHQGKIFHLTPTPDVQACDDASLSLLYERFWLCDSCAKKLTLVWGGTQARLVPLPEKPGILEAVESGKVVHKHSPHRRAARVGRQRG